MMRRTKIVCTLGPATDDYSVLKSMIRAGMNVARLNFSHSTYDEHKRRMDMVKRARKELGVPVAILLDTKGPEIRIRTFKDGKVELKKGDKFTLTTREIEGDKTIVSVSYEDLPQYVKKGTRILVNDGLIELSVDSVNKTDIVTTVMNDGYLSNRKSINMPDTFIDMPYLSDGDRADIEFGISQDVDYIAMSFVRSVDDVRIIKRLLNENDANNIQLIAKIENRSGVDNVMSILAECDGVMVARGDMGVEIPFEELPGIQKDIISRCYRSGKKVITATQMLESMVTNPRPTRAEISDVANAVYDGSSAIMLSGETAAGNYPVESVRTMATIAERAESGIDYKKRFNALDADIKSITDAVSHSTCAAAFDLDAKAIIAVSQSGYTARKISRFRPSAPIIAPTTSEKAYNQLAMNWGVVPTLSKKQDSSDELFRHVVNCALNTGMVSEGDLVVVAAGVPVGVSGNTNTMRIETVKRF
ncbi:MAG: pyruvate kinase [Clostridiales bacterium]|nr:pyruvate kinase [Clostridiales bacterium]